MQIRSVSIILIERTFLFTATIFFAPAKRGKLSKVFFLEVQFSELKKINYFLFTTEMYEQVFNIYRES